MQAVIHTGGQQFTVSEGDVIHVDLLGSEVGGECRFEDVRLLSSDKSTTVGTPRVDGAVVVGTVLDEVKGPKLRSLKYRRRKDSQTVKGHRQRYHRVRIDTIQA
jgi:large subunit ribosomal protein L21